jgi:hypothetical protein
VRTELSPRVVPWIAINLSPPAYEIKAKVEEWLECHSNEPLWTIPVARDQMFRLPNGHYFLIAGIIPTGEISGRYFYPTRKRGRTYGPDGTLFPKPDWRPFFSSQPRGSAWDTLLPPGGLAAAHRVLVIRSPGQAEVVYEHTRVSGLPVHPSPAGPTEPVTLLVIAEAADWLRENNLIPSHMSSDAGYHVAKHPPSAAWSATPFIASNVTAAVVVVGAGHIPDVTKPQLIIRVTGIERLRRANAFLGELVGAVLMTFLRVCFANPIYAYMDCQSVMKIVQRNWKATSDAPEDRAYGALVQAIIRVDAPQHPPIDYTQCHPENSRGATVTVPGRPAIPRKDWTLQNHLNVLADTYSEPQLPTGLPDALIPHRVMEVEVSVLLNAVMPMNGLYWQHDGIPTVNQVGSMSTQRTEDYLQQRSEAGTYYDTRYWPGSEVGLLPPVLNIIAPSCNYSQRASFMGLMLDQVPHDRKLAQYENMAEPLPCPLCNAPYKTLEHVILDCPALSATRAGIKEVAFHPYLLQGNPRSSSSRPLPKQIKKYMNLLLKHAFTGDALSSDVEAVAIWLARPQNTTLEQLDQATNAAFDKDTQQRLRKELLKAVPHLTRSARQLWQERCQKASIVNGTGAGSLYPMTVSAYSPGTYVSTMKVFFEARSTGVDDSPTPSPET